VDRHGGAGRWEHPEHGLLGPMEFIPMAETSSQIIPLGTWVLDTRSPRAPAGARRCSTRRSSA
jgi:EAL domain-containing protein (putative c-di-GMP-specific phosphodiesterase class I)